MSGRTITMRGIQNCFTSWKSCIYGKRMSLNCWTAKYYLVKLLRIFFRKKSSLWQTWDIPNTYRVIYAQTFVSNIIRSLQSLIILIRRTVTRRKVHSFSHFIILEFSIRKASANINSCSYFEINIIRMALFYSHELWLGHWMEGRNIGKFALQARTFLYLQWKWIVNYVWRQLFCLFSKWNPKNKPNYSVQFNGLHGNI